MSAESTAVAAAPPGGRARLARVARNMLRRRLAGLEHGQLSVRDPWGNWSVGRGGPKTSIVVGNAAFYLDVALEGGLGAARAWVDGHWHTDDLTGVLRLLLRNVDLVDRIEGGSAALAGLAVRVRHLLNRNSRRGARRNVHAHYDLGNALFALFLDDSMTYSCAVYEHEDATLEQAQAAKLERICRKLALAPGDHVLEIGTGWGSFAIHAARHHGCRVATTTISREQHALALDRVRAAGLESRIDVLLCDYRDLPGRYDKLVSIEMIEAVGHGFLPAYFDACSRRLRDDGAMLLQAITMPDQRYARYLKSSDFIQQVVFPGSCCPSLTAMLGAVREHSDLRLAHLEDLGLHYARTLAEWRRRFDAREAEVRALGCPETFLRTWRYYLSYCEAGFAERYTGVVQLLFEKPARRAAPVLGTLPPAAREAR